jgi:hypothetical protein
VVHLLDEGSVFDAPIEKIWTYLRSEDHKHPSFKNVSREVSGNVATITSERIFMGKPVKVKIRNTLYPPVGYVSEHIEGPTAGSRAFVYYIPEGEKTGITVVGDFIIPNLDEKATREAVLAQMQITFDEDNSNLRRLK